MSTKTSERRDLSDMAIVVVGTQTTVVARPRDCSKQGTALSAHVIKQQIHHERIRNTTSRMRMFDTI